MVDQTSSILDIPVFKGNFFHCFKILLRFSQWWVWKKASLQYPKWNMSQVKNQWACLRI